MDLLRAIGSQTEEAVGADRVDFQADLRRAGIELWAWAINNSLTATESRSPLLQQRANHEYEQFKQVQEQHAQRLAVVPLQVEEPVGVTKLTKLGEQVPATPV